MIVHGTPAQEALWARKQELNYLTPCENDPHTWDPPGGGPRKGEPQRTYRRIRRALEGCHACLVKNECLDLLAEEEANKETVRGVWAGLIHYDPLFPDINARIKKLLEE